LQEKDGERLPNLLGGLKECHPVQKSKEKQAQGWEDKN
jgi:hypothetical protein